MNIIRAGESTLGAYSWFIMLNGHLFGERKTQVCNLSSSVHTYPHGETYYFGREKKFRKAMEHVKGQIRAEKRRAKK